MKRPKPGVEGVCSESVKNADALEHSLTDPQIVKHEDTTVPSKSISSLYSEELKSNFDTKICHNIHGRIIC